MEDPGQSDFVVMGRFRTDCEISVSGASAEKIDMAAWTSHPDGRFPHVRLADAFDDRIGPSASV